MVVMYPPKILAAKGGHSCVRFHAHEHLRQKLSKKDEGETPSGSSGLLCGGHLIGRRVDQIPLRPNKHVMHVETTILCWNTGVPPAKRISHSE
jgi:hypothetical protein